MKSIITVLVIFFFGFVCSQPWNSDNDPHSLQRNFEYVFSKLPTSAQLKTEPWSDTYWPSYLGGIAARWFNTSQPWGFDYELYNETQVKALNYSQLQRLSPAEKYDIFIDRFDYPTVHSEWSRTSPYDASWEGLCHGWAPASYFYKQPNAVNLTSSKGVVVPFGSSDVKALLTYYVAVYLGGRTESYLLGDRCNYDLEADPSKENVSSCFDINSGSYHVVVANSLNNGSGFVIDRDRSYMVWNQPIFSFASKVVSQKDELYQLEGSITYAKETQPMWEAHSTYLITENYNYTIEVDKNGTVTGGQFLSWDRPDFLWTETPEPNFYDIFGNLSVIYNASIMGASEFGPALNKEVLFKKDSQITIERSSQGIFGTNELITPQRRYVRSWSISPPAEATSITIQFTQFETQRYRALVKVYEGASAEGAVVAVLHGHSKENPSTITVNAPGAFVMFTVEDSTLPSGFTAHFKASYQ